MENDGKKEFELSVPGEWALKKAFGPVLSELGDDLKKLYAVGRDKILDAGYRKIENLEDGKQANLRITRDVLWNGAFSDAEICAEYFGGILASSRSEDGKDDGEIYFVDVIKSLSSSQLKLHYLIYNCLNKMLAVDSEKVNVAQGAEISQKAVYLSTIELEDTHKIATGKDFNIIFRQGLIHEYKTDKMVGDAGRAFLYSMAKPTTFGVMLYAVAHNRIHGWHSFSHVDFGNFDSIPCPKFFTDSEQEAKSIAGLTQQPDASTAE